MDRLILGIAITLSLTAVQQCTAGPIEVSAFSNRIVNWTRDGVLPYTTSKPFYVAWRDFLTFLCGDNDRSGLIYLLRDEEYEKVADACSSSSPVPATVMDSLCRPSPIADCKQDRLERRVDGVEDTANSCITASFRPGTLYHLTNFPADDPLRCLFSLPLKVCDIDDTECGRVPISPSPLSSPTVLVPLNLKPTTTPTRSLGGGKNSVSATTTTAAPVPSHTPNMMISTIESSASNSTHSLIVLSLLLFISAIFVKFLI